MLQLIHRTLAAMWSGIVAMGILALLNEVNDDTFLNNHMQIILGVQVTERIGQQLLVYELLVLFHLGVIGCLNTEGSSPGPATLTRHGHHVSTFALHREN